MLTPISPTNIYKQSGVTKTQLRYYATTQFRENFTGGSFEKALTDLENADIIYEDEGIWHDSEDFDLPTFN